MIKNENATCTWLENEQNEHDNFTWSDNDMKKGNMKNKTNKKQKNNPWSGLNLWPYKMIIIDDYYNDDYRWLL